MPGVAREVRAIRGCAFVLSHALREASTCMAGKQKMTQQKSFGSLLVPVDFSEASRGALRWALDYIDDDDALVVVLHVVDEQLADQIAEHEFAEKDEIIQRMRKRAEDRMNEYADMAAIPGRVDTMVSVGTPVLEILRKADDFAVDAIVMSKFGSGSRFEKLLFGSTAEKVLRGSRRPVIVVPLPANAP
jgi:nucleotide-binding universal stress UspA family protein